MIFTIILTNASLWSIHSLLAHTPTSNIYCIEECFSDYSEINLFFDGRFSLCLLCTYLASTNNLLPVEKGGNEVKDEIIFRAMPIFLKE